MDQTPAQSDLDSEMVPMVPDDAPPQDLPPSPFKKIIPFAVITVFILLILLLLMVLSGGKKTASNTVVATPTLRPTATPIAPTIPLVTQATSSVSASIAPVKTGRLVFIRDGDIYHSDLATISLLVKNATPAGDKLTWSSMGNFLGWRPKTLSATPSSVAVYNRTKKTSFTIKPFSGPNGEVLDFAFSPDETQLALLLHDSSYKIGFYNTSFSTTSANLYSRNIPVKQILWPENQTIIFSGDDGITGFDVENLSENSLIKNTNIQRIKLGPDGKKLLYSIGDDKTSTLYLYDIDTGTNQQINSIPSKINMGNTEIDPSVLRNGILPYAIFMPTGDKLIVGYKYLPNIPIVGIYSLKDQMFTAIAAFTFYETDMMVDDLRLLGTRVNTEGYIASKQVSLFTLEDNSKFGLIRIIPDASSPTFFGKDILPSGNNF